MSTVENPFLVKGYVLPKYFCNRTNETETLIKAATNGRDITLFSLRRMGKSGLLDNVGYYLKKKHDYLYIYSDVFNTESVEQLVAELTKDVIHQLFPKRSFLQKASTFFKHIQPIISFDEFTGSPQIQMSFTSESEAYQSLEQLFSFVNQFGKPVYWAWDEFQQLNQFSQSNRVIKELRSHVQRCNNIRFAFSGSHANMLLAIFNDAKQPFFKSTQLIELKEIASEDYSLFITKHFKAAKKNIDAEAIDKILKYTLNHTWYTQVLCNRLYQDFEDITVREVKHTLRTILEETELTFYRFRQLFTKKQWNLLKAVAKEEKVHQITSSKFIRQHNAGSSATILRSLEKLLNDEFIVEQYEEDEKYYRLNDVFLMRWMQWKY